ncbi:DNA-binding protein WhiA [Candidatus Atribacteria bacterium RBG_19FT_COMBO_35_14]|uniref:Probable cell division protein WhiA n=1 Tax=Candidatus Sediminicultor quintus TaxID=1797291 RepID=A0A1F5A6X6_9BACT|nr:MAG: DNA-binding protein WhiA [Candidatus Atribacteria bacterium RBG_19FT_COMBO_35_14]OGD33769.1 MAG: DNA-binding protein WhiA [Candidatus Atribacteria bacterium RBG_16_35_8]
MLFSYRVKTELARIIPKNIPEQKGELLAFIKLKGNVVKFGQKKNLVIILENPTTTRTAYKLIKRVFEICPSVKKENLSNTKKHYKVKIPFSKETERILKELNLSRGNEPIPNKQYIVGNRINLNKDFSKDSYLRGAFLANGFVNDPEKMYHLEISTNNEEEANFIHTLFNYYGLNSRISFWKKRWIAYLKRGDSIFEFLRLIGLQNALLYFQDIRARKDVLNIVNRLVNCETANLDKTVLSAAKQLRDIDVIEKKIGLQHLSPRLLLVAEVRKNLPYASLQELAEEVDFKITKSGIYHRLKKISQIAENL